MATPGLTKSEISTPNDRPQPGNVSLGQIIEQVNSYWGFDSLRPLQEDAIRATLMGQDSVVVLPTGGGKSLCYQVPPLVANRTDVVVSPLISLMKDQVDGLRACGYAAATIHSGHTEAENSETIRNLLAGRFQLIFISPERLLTHNFLNVARQLDVRSFAIDEAHCISHWGHDFRPEYRRLALLKKQFPKASVHAYTATATQRVREDIAKELQLQDPAMLVGTFDRANLTYRVVPRVDAHAQVIEVLSRHKDEGTIVYCLSRKDTENMAHALATAGIDARPYHAGLDPQQRRETQDAFANESLSVVTATVAFGMGIDRSNVRCVIHATMPKSIEHYQQETGRAGRDGLEAECVLLYSAADPMRWQSLIARSAEESPDVEQFMAAATSMLEDMRRYCAKLHCRHRALSEHFGQAYPKEDCEACDTCLSETEGLEDATEAAKRIVSCVARIEQHGDVRFGVKHLVDVLAGANTELIRKWHHDDLSTYGILKGTPRKTLSNWVYQLVDQDLLGRTASDHPVLFVNDASWEVMRGEQTVRLIRVQPPPSRKSHATIASWEGVDPELFEHLRQVRRELAQQDGVPAFVIFGDRTLRDLARRRPTTPDAFRQAHAIGAAKLEKFGERFLAEIKSYCTAHNLTTDGASKSDSSGHEAETPSSVSTDAARPAPKISPTKQTAFEMFAKEASVEDVMDATARARSTIAGYLQEFIATSKPASIKRWVPDVSYTAIAQAAGDLGVRRLKPIFKALDEKMSYDDIRSVLTHLEVRED